MLWQGDNRFSLPEFGEGVEGGCLLNPKFPSLNSKKGWW